MSSTLYRRGSVHSPSDPFAEAILVVDGAVAWLGADDTADGLVDRADEVVDLDGAVVTPGFVDSYVRLLDAFQPSVQVDLRDLRTVADVLDAIAQAPPDGPVFGYGLALGRWPVTDGPTRWELDRASGGRLALLIANDGYSGVVSSALANHSELLGQHGWRSDGRVTGPAFDAARAGLTALTPGGHDSAYREALGSASRRGVVALHEISDPHRETRQGLADLIALTRDPSSGLPQVLGYREELCGTADDVAAILLDVPGLSGVMMPRIDGTIASHTAFLSQVYADESTLGEQYFKAEDVANHVGAATRAGVQAGIRAVGDAATAEALLGLRVVSDIEGPVRLASGRHRLDDLTMIDAASLAQLLLFGTGVSLLPGPDVVGGRDGGMASTRLGSIRSDSLHPVGDLSGAGVPLGFGTGTSFDLWAQIRAVFSHPNPQQRVSARAAFRSATRGGWRLAGLDGTGAGELRVGAPAHLAIWRAERLVVESVEGRFSSWSSDARAGTPLLPSVSEDAPTPECLRTVRMGEVLFDTFR